MNRLGRTSVRSISMLIGSALLWAASAWAQSATVTTSKQDYVPGETVVISGSGYLPGETVTLTLQESPFIDTHGPYTSTADATAGDHLSAGQGPAVRRLDCSQQHR
jgi:hypothetical protein